MKLLMQIDATSELLCHEALSMAFALAAFDHYVQLQLGEPLVKRLMAEPDSKLAKMLGSLELYDMPPAWVQAHDMALLNAWQPIHGQAFEWQTQLQAAPKDKTANIFDATFCL